SQGWVNIGGRFSPDGRWLVTDADGGRLYAAGTWEPEPQLGPGAPWDITSELAVLGLPNGVYRLVELATGRELARLEDPEQNTAPAALTPEGTKLVVAARNGLRVWDLRRIRAELAKMDLDWEAPPYPPTQESKDQRALEAPATRGPLPPETPQQAVVKYPLASALMPFNREAYLRRGRAHSQLQHWREAADDLGVALALNPANKDLQVWF